MTIAENSSPFNYDAGKSTPTYDKGVINVDQGFYNNIASPISDIPLQTLAFVSNSEKIYESDVVINLAPTSLSWSDFVSLFFKSPGNGFSISLANSASKPVAFYNQYYESTENKLKKFYLTDQLTKAWAKKHAMAVSSISPHMEILLHRFSFLVKSIATLKQYSVGLSLDEAICALLAEDSIVLGDLEDTATVKFKITSLIHFEPLNTAITVNFFFNTLIPNYKNSGKGVRDFIYSSDKSSNRDSFVNINDLGINNIYKTDMNKLSKNDDAHSERSSDNDSLIFSEISKLIKEEDDASNDGSSQW